MILAIDSGNSRIKWGLHDGTAWLRRGDAPAGAFAQLAQDWQNLPQPRRIAVSNVAGEFARRELAALLARWPLLPLWVAARESQCGVHNGYAQPAQLGSDRWAALVAARRLHRGACLVVNAGTALTADALSGEGVFRGGVIVPGIGLMLGALAQKSAALATPPGEFHSFPANTADALYSGALHALCGTVERMFRLADGDACFLGGGAAPLLAPHLNLPLRLVDNLVLEGLLRIALEESPP